MAIALAWGTGISLAADVLEPAWSLVIRQPSDAYPALGADGTIYFGSFDGRFWAVDSNGNKKWIFRAAREIKSSPAVGEDGTVYFGSRDRCFYAVSAEGEKRWQFKTGAWVDSSPAIGKSAVYFGSWDKHFYALSFDGALQWRFETAGPIVSSPAIGGNGRIYFGSHDGKLYALAPEGTKAWEFATSGPIVSSPAIDRNGVVYLTSVDGNLYALTSEGAEKWRLKTGGITTSSPVIGEDGTVFVGVNETLWAVQADGKKKWVQPYKDPVDAAPTAFGDGSVCFTSGNGHLINLNVAHQFNWERTWACPKAGQTVGPDGTLFTFGHVLNVGQVLYALKTGVPLARSGWPKFRGDLRNTGRVRAAE